jgi:predicted O-methyltransferase YrrM
MSNYLNLTETELNRLASVCSELRVIEAGNHKHNFINGLLYFTSLVKPKSVIEIGCYKGTSTEMFCLLVDKVTVVDPFLYPEAKEEFYRRMEPYMHKLTIIEGYSPEALKDIPDGSFDMCYIDGNHDFEAVLKDIDECKRVVKHAGVLAGHDYEVVPQVTAAVILGLHGLEPEIVLNDSTWVTCNAV